MMSSHNKQLQEELGVSAPISIDDEFAFNEEYEINPEIEEIELHKKHREKQAPVSMQARRAIEEHNEKKRLHKELDYLFDDHFGEEE